jgi:hypothetical protein
MKKLLFSTLLSLLLTLTSSASEMKTDNGYLIHYNATGTEFMPPEVARNYQIVRSKNRAMLTVVVLKPNSDKELLHPSVLAVVTAQVVNLNQQLRTIEMKKVQEGEAIYYIGVFTVNNEETLDFTIKVQPESQGKVHEITFRQQFFVD